ncbi:hypothetical protein COV56_01915 [Candidatus Kuenenbacteria bacterium CG11_big_fil_rev_8_21_14_0_20_37_9]|uniref:Methyltransferase type 11 domain-containing protein n=2 Tax=Candidatus Kueneniibacteriota TaxID=1752740 RepID=A0A2M6XSW2_9BACT|nr:MAG: hypothetical protein AUJ29_01920 [Candidatus Kuenenbacteria bacterium CG1_02_38_13]PIR05595.1 MAG: hypothetical protein COV56_01915 [Candidatus Kuenenbacteria bacterium CG11_big_fil_rev_8_21_14_0_20_37_9]PIU10730.1 MAG: hypothetical protein COT27_01715 [Candidatus Kuenenbacteria bacterium CG08_land_8_20_14_0_20_37_23]
MSHTCERLTLNGKATDKNLDLYQEHIRRYHFCLPFIKNKKVLDIACGIGYGAKLMADNQALEVFAGDVSSSAISIARKKYVANNLHFQQMDALAIPFSNNYFDTIVSLETIEHIGRYERFMSEISRCLKFGGTLVLSTPNRKSVKRLDVSNQFHIKEFTQDELLELLDVYFKNIELFGQRKLSRPDKLQKLFKKLHFIINGIPFLGVLRDNLPYSLRHKIGQNIDGLDDDFSIRKIEDHQDFLYFIAVARKSLHASTLAENFA